MPEVKKVLIPRKTWLRGESAIKSRLLRTEDGKMCCLGNVLLAFGVKEEDIRDLIVPAAVDSPLTPSCLLTQGTLIRSPGIMPENINSALCIKMMATNDYQPTSDIEREASLKKMAKEGGQFTLEFVD